MTGLQLRAIRWFNKISQKKFGKQIGFSQQTVSRIERMVSVPQITINAMSKLIERDLSKDEVVEQLLTQIPSRYFQEYHNSINIFSDRRNSLRLKEY